MDVKRAGVCNFTVRGSDVEHDLPAMYLPLLGCVLATLLYGLKQAALHIISCLSNAKGICGFSPKWRATAVAWSDTCGAACWTCP